MTTDQDTMREKIARALRDQDRADASSNVWEFCVYLDMADAVLPVVREAQKKAWDECAQEQGTWHRPKGDPRALTFILLANNPYREESTDDE